MSSKTMSDDELAQIASEVAGDLMDRLLVEAKALPDVWQKLSEAKQRAWLDRARSSVVSGVTKSVNLIAAQNNPALRAVVDQVVFKDGVKIVLKAMSTGAAHDLADHEGQSVVVVICDAEEFMGGLDDDRADLQQPELPAS